VTETLLIGSGNPKKAREIAVLLEGLPWEVKSLRDMAPVEAPEETGTTFAQNAVLKARFYAGHFGVACLADDSGLVVDALDGAPGVYSARYAGPDGDDEANVEKLLDALAEYPWHERTARFVCVAAFVRPGEEPHIERGVIKGHIAADPYGENGFGYDPVFVPENHEITFAEMDPGDKHAVSHRGRALAKMREYLKSLA
jgi:XTP/dITP diphosphohydrolase